LTRNLPSFYGIAGQARNDGGGNDVHYINFAHKLSSIAYNLFYHFLYFKAGKHDFPAAIIAFYLYIRADPQNRKRKRFFPARMIFFRLYFIADRQIQFIPPRLSL